MNLSQNIFSLHDKCQLPGQKYPTFAGFTQGVQAMMEDALETLENEPAGQAVGEPAPVIRAFEPVKSNGGVIAPSCQ